MVEVLEFVFRGFWTWLGTVVLLATFGDAMRTTIRTVVKR